MITKDVHLSADIIIRHPELVNLCGSMSLCRSKAASRMAKDCNSNWLDGGPIAPLPPRATASFPDDAIEVVVTRLDVGPEAVRASAALLSDAERLRASRFAFDRDRRRFTVARAWLRRLLSARLGVPETVELVYGANGKPALARRFGDSDLRFNLSHSAELAVYAFAAGREVGPGRVGMFLPCKEWGRSADAPLRWRSVARDTEEYFGPDGCNGDLMLREPYAPKFAELFRQCRGRNVTENAP